MSTPRLVLHALREARALLDEPSHWTTNALARTSIGEVCDPFDARACSWCLEGALRKVDATGAFIVARDALTSMIENKLPSNVSLINHIARFNDAHGHQAVLDLIDRTIERLSQDAQP